jgi:hypothetical protein
MDEWQEDRESLVDLFGRVRDDWIENDFSGWIGANRWLIYEIIGAYFLFWLKNIFGEIKSDLTKHFFFTSFSLVLSSVEGNTSELSETFSGWSWM